MTTPSTLSNGLPGCTLTGTYVKLDGTPIVGSVSLTATPDVLLDYNAFRVVVPNGLMVTLDAQGHFEITVPATDDPDVSPINWTYRVTENFVGGRTYSIEAPAGQNIDLVNAMPVPDSKGDVIARGPAGVSMSGATWGPDGSLTVEMSDGTAIDVGKAPVMTDIDGGDPSGDVTMTGDFDGGTPASTITAF